jgi:hypothetical protein
MRSHVLLCLAHEFDCVGLLALSVETLELAMYSVYMATYKLSHYVATSNTWYQADICIRHN